MVTNADVVRQAQMTVRTSVMLIHAKRDTQEIEQESAPDLTFAQFCKMVYRGYLDESRHIQLLTDTLQEALDTPNSRTIITMPPRHSKSVHVSELLPAYALGQHPDWRVIAATHSQSLADKFSRRVRNRIGDIKWPFKRVRVAHDKGAVQRWDIEGTDGGYVAVGRGGSPTGEGAHLMIVDDPIRNARDAESETVRDMLWEWWTGTMYTRLEPGARVIVTATRWHEDDLTGRLIAEQSKSGETWTHIHLPAIADALDDPIDRQIGDALWEERYPIERLNVIRDNVGERVWQSQYQGRPTSGEGAIIKESQFARYLQLPAHIHTIVQSWDTAFKVGTANDYSVCSTWGVGMNGAYLIHVMRDQLEYPQLVSASISLAQRWNPTTMLVEDKGSGQSLIQTLKKETMLPVVGVPVPPGAGKRARLEQITPMIEAGRVFLPEWAEWLRDYLKELTGFPFGAHDDQVDSTSQALARIFNLDTDGGGRVRSRSYIDDDDDRFVG